MKSHSNAISGVECQNQVHFALLSQSLNVHSQTSETGFSLLDSAINHQSKDLQTRFAHIGIKLQETARSDQRLLSVLKTLENQLQVTQSVTNRQYEELLAKLEQLGQCNQASYGRNSASTNSIGSRADEETDGSRDVMYEVDDAIGRLRSYAHEKDKTIFSEKVQPIIDAIDFILEFATHPLGSHQPSRKRGLDALDNDMGNETLSSKRLRRLISGAQQVKVNDNGQFFRKPPDSFA